MKSGKWIPLCKALVSALPRGGRPFTKLEAMFSLTLDYDNGSPVTVSGYASLWSWSERQVRRFLEEVGVAICYPQNTRSRQNQRGEISVVIPEGNRRESGEIKIIDSKGLASETERKRREAGEKAERKRRDPRRLLKNLILILNLKEKDLCLLPLKRSGRTAMRDRTESTLNDGWTTTRATDGWSARTV